MGDVVTSRPAARLVREYMTSTFLPAIAAIVRERDRAAEHGPMGHGRAQQQWSGPAQRVPSLRSKQNDEKGVRYQNSNIC